MVLLGVADGLDSGAALWVDGRIVAAVNEEHLTREKLTTDFPYRSIATVLEMAGLAPQDVRQVALASEMTPLAVMRAMPRAYKFLKRGWSNFTPMLQVAILYHAAAHRLVLPQHLEGRVGGVFVARRLASMEIRAPITLVEHHHAHASASFWASGFERALVVTMDGLGDGLSVAVGVGDSEQGVQRVHEESGLAASCVFYARLTQTLGFRPIRDEGKVMGLAAHGDGEDHRELARRLLRWKEGRFNRHPVLLPVSPRWGAWRQVRLRDPIDVATAFQENFEEQVSSLIAHWVERTGLHSVALGGGAFANVKLNQRILGLAGVHETFIFPHMGDGGLAYGAVVAQRPIRGLEHVNLGPSFSEARMRRALDDVGLAWTRPERIAEAGRGGPRGGALPGPAGVRPSRPWWSLHPRRSIGPHPDRLAQRPPRAHGVHALRASGAG